MKLKITIFTLSIITILLVTGANAQSLSATDTYTSTSKTICTDNICNVLIYSNPVFLDGTGKTLTDVSELKWENNGFNFSYNDEYWVLIEPFIRTTTDNDYGIQELKAQIPELGFKNHRNFTRFNHKFAIDVTGVDVGILSNIKYFGFRILDFNGITLNDISNNDATSITIKDRVKVDFTDLVESGYTIQFENKTTLLIEDLEGNIKAGTLFLDPNILLEVGETENMDDGIVDSNSPNDFYNDGVLQIGRGTSSDNLTAVMKWNLSMIPDDNTIQSAILRLYTYATGTGNHSNYTVWGVRNESWFENANQVSQNILYSSAWTNGRELLAYNDTYVGEHLINTWFDFNVTDYANSEFQADIRNLSFIVNVSQFVGTENGLFRSSEYAGGEKPVLNITYNTTVAAPEEPESEALVSGINAVLLGILVTIYAIALLFSVVKSLQADPSSENIKRMAIFIILGLLFIMIIAAVVTSII